MNISPNNNLFSWANSVIDRYSNLIQPNQMNTFSPDLKSPSNNYSYFNSKQVTDDFTNLAKKAQVFNQGVSGNAFDKAGASATSSSNKAVAVKTANGAAQATYNLQINQVAKAQENTGNWTDAKSKTLAINGGQAFTIKVNDQNGYTSKSADVNIQTKTSQTNKEVLTQTAEAINKKSKDLGVQARVESRTVNGVEQNRLVVANTKTGTNTGNFTIKDTTGKLAANTAINNVTTSAQNAKYSINGFTRESQTNEIDLDRRGQVKATLKNTTSPGETVKIGVQPQDVNSINNNVKDFVNQYNKAIKDLANPQNRSTAQSQQNFGLTQINSNDRSKLAAIGITVNSDHTLSLNENHLKTALTYDSAKVQDTLSGPNGFTGKIEDKITNADLNNVPNSDTNTNNPNGYFPGKFFNYYL